MTQISGPDSLTDGPAPAERLAALRRHLSTQGLDGFLIPRTDPWQGEWLPPAAERLWWLSGFSGSAGFAIVTARAAAIFVDGRYTLQLPDQVDTRLFNPQPWRETALEAWCKQHLTAGMTIGFDPWLHTRRSLAPLRRALETAGAALAPVGDGENPVDAVWRNRPAPPAAPVFPHPLQYAGVSSADKRTTLAQLLADAGQDAALVADGESIAWLLNIRGGDIPACPLVRGRVIIRRDAGTELFLDPAQVTAETRAHLGAAVTVRPLGAFVAALDALGKAGASVRVDPSSCPLFALTRLQEAGARLAEAEDPCLLPRARKNATELAGTFTAHRRDGAALTRFLKWLAATPPDQLPTERALSDRLHEYRAADPLFRGESFSTIAGFGPNGAIVHYRPTARSDRRLEPGSLLLLDSGGQYPDGTTDVTRTIAIGQPSAEMKRAFTLVLKGHIALAMARFPRGTSGAQLDALARAPLWAAGLDYAHGTGHGVGSYLNVHEGPQGISPRGGAAALEPGMILSNEPGYYKSGAWGIRIENLVAVVADGMGADGETPFYRLDTVTRAPIDLTLADASLLTGAECQWLNGYHASVRRDIDPLLDAETRAWLARTTADIG